MARNLYFSDNVKSEQNLYEDLIIESLKLYGQDVYYLPRDIVNENRVFGDDVPSSFNSSHKIEMYIENPQGFEGGDVYAKWGVEIRDQVTMIVSRKRWLQTVRSNDNEITGTRPYEGDLLYLPLSGSMFEIMHVEHEQPFFKISDLPTYKLKCELFEYNDENLDTGIVEIDSIERGGYELVLNLADSDGADFIIGENVSQSLAGGVIITGKITYYNDSDNILKLAHIGADDGLYHKFIAGSITASESLITRTIISVDDELAQVNSQNEDFKDQASTLLDWSESNPFGEPENN